MTDEQQFTADWFSKPGDSLRSSMRRRQVAAQQLAESLPGGMGEVRGLLDGSLRIDSTTAEILSGLVGGSVSFWLKRQANYERALEEALETALNFEMDEWLAHVPSPVARTPGRPTTKRAREELRQRLVFFNVSNFRAWEARYGQLCEVTRFRTSQSFASNHGSVLGWLRRGELEADLISTRTWNPGNLQDRLDEIRKLTRLSRPNRFLPKLRELCAEAGVALVVVKTPRGCHASGASRLVTSDKAMVLVSFRHRSDDHFWFTVFHEIGHLLLHGAATFVDGDEVPLNKAEQEANKFASESIIPERYHNQMGALPLERETIMRFARSIGVSPGLVVGQLQHREIVPHSKLNYLKRHWSWAEIESAFD